MAAEPANQTTPSERAGLTDAFVTGMATRLVTAKPRPIATGAKPLRGTVIGGAQDDVDEGRGDDDLDDEPGHEPITAGRSIAVPVRGEATFNGIEPGLAIRDREQHGTSNRRGDNLSDDVRQYVLPLEPFRDRQTDADGRVEMPAGDVPKGIRADQHGQAKCKRDPEEPDPELHAVISEECRGQDRCSTSHEHQQERPEEFGAQFCSQRRFPHVAPLCLTGAA